MRFLGATLESTVRARFWMAAHLLAGVSTAEDLAQQTGVSRGAAQRFLTDLLDGGYVTARPAAEPKAPVEYEFTRKGRGYLKGELERWVYAGVEDAEIATMISIGLM
ncbi:MAG: helix-turn-helix domain-containing protein [Actinomycetota bacterium]